ncbi:kinase-like domain-containing protein [Blastocladiella britannica]|nr:kinase-like domain-containing protein [Blastocladiella britannica]
MGAPPTVSSRLHAPATVPPTSSPPAPTLRAFTLQDFEIGRSLGTGQFGHVYLARVRGTEAVVALKVLFKHQIVAQGVEEQVRHEIDLQANIRHPNVLRLFTWFGDEKCIYLVLEYAAGGELYAKLKRETCFDCATAAHYILQIANSLLFLHARNVIHRDLKPENLLLTHDDTVRLADFGWSVFSEQDRRSTFCGTMDYLSPEHLTKRPSYTSAVDQWALGAMLYEFLTGEAPFYAATNRETYARIERGDIKFPPDFDPLAMDLVKKLLVKNPEQRLPLAHVLVHPFVETYARETLAAIWIAPSVLGMVEDARAKRRLGLFADLEERVRRLQ